MKIPAFNRINAHRPVGIMVLSGLLLLPSVSWAADGASSCPPDASGRLAESRAASAEAKAARGRGDKAGGLQLYLKAWSLLPECDKFHGRRVTALEVLMAALRDEVLGEPGRVQRLDQALTLLNEYLQQLTDVYGSEAPRTEGFAVASGLREAIVKERAQLVPVVPEASEPTAPSAQPEPEAEPQVASSNENPLPPSTVERAPAEPSDAVVRDEEVRALRRSTLGWSLGGAVVGVVGGGLWLAGGLLRNIAWSDQTCATSAIAVVRNCRERLARAVNIEGAGSALAGGGIGLTITGLTNLAKLPHRRPAWIAEASLGAAALVAGAVWLGTARGDYNAFNVGGPSVSANKLWTDPEYVAGTERSTTGFIAARMMLGLGGGLLLGSVTNLVLAGRSPKRVRVDVTAGSGLSLLGKF